MASLDGQTRPKEYIRDLSEALLAAFQDVALIDEYAIYQSLMEFWAATMQDDTYLIVDSGWEEAAKPVYRAEERGSVDFTVGRTSSSQNSFRQISSRSVLR